MGHGGRLTLLVLLAALVAATAVAQTATPTHESSPPPPAPEPDPDLANVTWQEAFLVGTDNRQRPARTEGLASRGSQGTDVYLILAGENNGLPVYCGEAAKLRLEGRAVPARLVVTPRQAGLAGAEIHWAWLRPVDGGNAWVKMEMPQGANRWTQNLIELPGDVPGVPRHCGTTRLAASIRIGPPGGAGARLETDGWTLEPQHRNPESAPGYRITRHGGLSLSDTVLGFMRLPVAEGVSTAHVREKVALRPIDLVLAPYEELTGVTLPISRDEPLAGEAWSWLFVPTLEDLFRRTRREAPLVSPAGRGIPWGGALTNRRDAVRQGDLLVLEDTIAWLEVDDGDGWLGEGDIVLHTGHGEIRRTQLLEVPGRKVDVLRLRGFRTLRADFAEAGYGPAQRRRPLTGAQAEHLDPDLLRAIREFQQDQGLPVTGVPDVTTTAALAAFLTALRSHDGDDADASSP